VRDGESGDHRRHLAEARRDQDESEHEGQVIGAGPDVLDPDHQVGPERATGGPIGAVVCLRHQPPDRLGRGEYPLEGRGSRRPHPGEVQVARRDFVQERTPDLSWSAFPTVDAPLERHPTRRCGEDPGCAAERTGLTSGEQL
jgi:hypothetical protein